MKDFPLLIEYKKQKEWSHMPMWAEMAVGAIGAGLFVVSYFLQFNLGIIGAYLLVMVGKGFIMLLDLGHSERFLNVFKRPGSSWVSNGAWGLMIFAALGGLTVLPTIFTALPWQPWMGFGKVIGLLAATMAAFIMIYDGFLLAKSKGIAFWGNGSMPMLFGSSATAGGIGAYFIIAPLSGLSADVTTLTAINLATLFILGINLYVCISYSYNVKEGAKNSAQRLTNGNLSKPFWIGTVIVGVLLPLVMVVWSFLGLPLVESNFTWRLVGLAEVIGVVFLRYSILKAGVYSPAIDG